MWENYTYIANNQIGYIKNEPYCEQKNESHQ